ncbi:glycosyltransferase family 2 protein [Desulforhopalus singaporensis]|uniref:Glycosyl transferase family 2 n=1 Tax=Desulforhopalus singaporensis TaxID=91360 RepID=A0A1H0PHH5_9BACT|nr:glycosyltransferase family A protein [Desulforhopalus singaporensis]SDP04220.1 Glycosyl transferase family 2 [Desulforhopalus singaporensis]
MSGCPISVIIPTFNRVTMVGRAIDSVFRQTLPCNELIVVDDGSTDGSPELLVKLQKHSGIPMRIITTSNRGPAAARNRGIEAATNDIVAFLDSDDHWHRKKLERQYPVFKDSGKYLISHTREKWLRRGEHLNQKKKHIPRHGHIFDHCLMLCGVGMSTVMATKEIFARIGMFDETMRCCEDYDLWLRASARYPFLLIDSPLTVKEGGRQDQVSFQYRIGMDEWRIKSIRKILDSNVLSPDYYAAACDELERKIDIFAGGCIKHGLETKGRLYMEIKNQYIRKAGLQ